MLRCKHTSRTALFTAFITVTEDMQTARLQSDSVMRQGRIKVIKM